MPSPRVKQSTWTLQFLMGTLRVLHALQFVGAHFKNRVLAHHSFCWGALHNRVLTHYSCCWGPFKNRVLAHYSVCWGPLWKQSTYDLVRSNISVDNMFFTKNEENLRVKHHEGALKRGTRDKCLTCLPPCDSVGSPNWGMWRRLIPAQGSPTSLWPLPL